MRGATTLLVALGLVLATMFGITIVGGVDAAKALELHTVLLAISGGIAGAALPRAGDEPAQVVEPPAFDDEFDTDETSGDK